MVDMASPLSPQNGPEEISNVSSSSKRTIRRCWGSRYFTLPSTLPAVTSPPAATPPPAAPKTPTILSDTGRMMRKVPRPVSYNLIDLQRANEGLSPVQRVPVKNSSGKKPGNNKTPVTNIKNTKTKTKTNVKKDTKKPKKDKTKRTQTGRVEKVKANTKKKVAAGGKKGGKKGKKASPAPSTTEESGYDE
ncbi:hypothetical protein CFE70_009330 [Pyrenophora teres f. teres 0-1]|uniref:Uncharacterized protein n=2 Tax=Pyrenophora teres f. teres TaxID=97479 RepID=E3RP46_PYRTT|nr:hypothetical protein PTT_10377 [Pyrenophora teres f. teres 0-1]KAE8824180.1 hypothetical protein HRS9139_09362 [Pyrenophora teres f. teres]CAA9965938.1 hypothetical protein PTMSG1_09297 [Pyrenophora teres f. maculata]KAE8827383.1 hypothetical protein PTNB85_08736 [Pyrenophora teres f. teres]KAE8831321.1 hypothetical protein HRS9122_08911 [Pyrenophora teres f. teres]